MYKFSLLLTAALFAALNAPAQDSLTAALPLLQKNNRTASENQRVLDLFRTSKDPNTVFAAGASLVKTPPAKTQEPALFNIILRGDDPLKQTFSAVIITAMGSVHEELLPELEGALSSKDEVLRSYAAAAYAIVKPQNKTYAPEIIRLYIYDSAFATRAMNLLAATPKEQLKYLKSASGSADAQTRAAAASWLGTLHSEDAAKQLLKMAKTEADSQTAALIATGLAKNRQYTFDAVTKELRRDYNSAPAATYALALGFMTGNAIDAIRQGLVSDNQNERINAARAAAYMAGVLANPDAFTYTSDREFDIGLLKSLIPQLNLLVKTGNSSVKVYADNALRQIEKLMI